MSRKRSILGSILLTAVVGSLGAGVQDSAENPVAPDEQLWRQVEQLAKPLPAVEPYEPRFDAEIDRLERLIARLASYERQFPGGVRFQDAVATELAAQLHLATLTHSSARFAARCAELSELSLGETLRAKLDRYRELARRLADGPRLLETLRNGASTKPISGEAMSAGSSGDSPASTRGAAARRSFAIGQPLMFDADGDLTDGLRAAGLCERPVLVVVWASWDARSIDELAAVAWARELAPDLGTLGVSIDLDAGRMQDAIDAYALEGVQIRAEQGWASPLLTSWELRRLPAVLLIDRDGVLRAVEENGDVFEIVARLARPGPP